MCTECGNKLDPIGTVKTAVEPYIDDKGKPSATTQWLVERRVVAHQMKYTGGYESLDADWTAEWKERRSRVGIPVFAVGVK